MISYIFTLLFLLFHLARCVTYNAYVDLSRPVRTIPNDAFLSVTTDSANLERADWFGENFTYLQPLARALAPAFNRFGGTAADMVVFQENPSYKNETSKNERKWTPVYMSGYQFEQIANFTRDAGWNLLIDLNQMMRSPDTPDGSWNSTNARQLLDYASARGYDNIHFELGNEPVFYFRHFNYSLNGSQVADGYRTLKNLINSYDFYKNSTIIGPAWWNGLDGYANQSRLKDFLNSGGGDYINAISYHFYYCAGETAQLSDFLDPNTLGPFQTSINTVLEIKNSFPQYQNLPVWVGEISSCFHGGASNLSNTYASSFIYLDTLGIASKYGLNGVVRQQFYDGNWFPGVNSNYSLIGWDSVPNPDYWIALMYKKLVGNQIYNVSFSPANKYLRLYAGSTVNNNGIVVYGISLSNVSLMLDFPNASSKTVTVYIFKESPLESLNSRTSTINGGLLQWQSHQPSPDFTKKISSLPIEIPEYSQFFLVINEPNNTQCPTGWFKVNSNANKCIKIVSKIQPLFAAKLDCTTSGRNASVLSIDSVFENAEILKQASNSECSSLYIGLVRTENAWMWSNNDTSQLTNWKAGYPKSDNTQNCVIFDSTSGTWSNIDCDQAHCYICQQNV